MVNINERSGGNLGGVPASIVATLGIRGLCGFFLKSAHEDDKPSNISDYGNPTLAECRSIHYHAYEAYITVSMLLSLDRSIYRKLIEDLSNSYLVDTNHYPHTRAKMQDTIVCCRNRAARYGLRTPPGAVIFVQDNYDDSANGETHSHNGQREPQYLSKVKCFRCQKFGHFVNKGPNGAKTGETHENVGAKEASDDNMDRLTSTLEIDD